MHWRHGDYVAYKLATSLAKVVGSAQLALDELRCAGDCAVFLMSNCRNASALAELSAALPTLVRYEPPAGRTRFAEEGARLVIEQAIAAQADVFLGSPRSAVSQYVEQLRRARHGAESSRFL